MKHPNEAELALYAGGDLGWVSRRLADRHIRQCGSCQATVSEFSELRPGFRAFPPMPANGIGWKRMESEMTANIRLGIAAGECVGMRPARESRLPALTFSRLGMACGVLVAVAGIAYIAGHPPSGMLSPSAALGISNPALAAGSVLESSDASLQLHQGGQTLRVFNVLGRDVSHSVGARGELGARYVDPDGYVTISQIYGQ